MGCSLGSICLCKRLADRKGDCVASNAVLKARFDVHSGVRQSVHVCGLLHSATFSTLFCWLLRCSSFTLTTDGLILCPVYVLSRRKGRASGRLENRQS